MAAKTLSAAYVLDASGMARGRAQAEKEMSALDASAARMSDSFDKHTSRMGNAFSSLSGGIASFVGNNPISAMLDKTAGHLEKAKTDASGYGKVLADVGKMATVGLGGGLVVAGAMSIRAAGDFQQSMTELVTGAGEAQSNIGLVSKGIRSMAGQVGTTPQQLAAGMYLIESAGYHGAAGLQVLRASAEGAKVGNADMATVADAVTSVLHNYGLSAGQASAVTSQLVATVAAGKTHMSDLAGSLSAVLPVAAKAGLNFAQVGGAIATMTSSGMSAQQASQDLANTIRSLVNPTAAQTKAMAQYGLSSVDVASHLGQRGLTGTLGLLVSAITSKMGPAGLVLQSTFNQSRAAAQDAQEMLAHLPASVQGLARQFLAGSIPLKQWRADLKSLPVGQAALLGQFSATATAAHGFSDALKSGSPQAITFNAALSKVLGTSTAANTALMLTGTSASAFSANVGSISGAAKTGAKNVAGWGAVQKDLNFQLQSAQANIQSLEISFGNYLIPKLQEVMAFTGSVVRWFEKHKDVALALGAAIAGPVALAVGAFAVQSIGSMISGLASATRGIDSFVTKMLRIGPTAAAGAGEVEAAEEGMAATSEEAGAASAAGFGPIGIALMGLVVVGTFVATHWKAIWRDVKAWTLDAYHALDAAWQAVDASARRIWGDIEGFFKRWWPEILGVFTGGIGLVVGLVIQHWSEISATTAQLWHDVSGFFARMWADVESVVSKGAGLVVEIFWKLPAQVLKAVAGLADDMFNFGSKLIQRLIDGIEHMAGSLASSVTKTIGGALSHIPGGSSVAHLIGLASGGIVTSPTLAVIGEAGPEMVLPMSLLRGASVAGAGVSPLPPVAAAGSGAAPVVGAGPVNINITVSGLVTGTPAQVAAALVGPMSAALKARAQVNGTSGLSL